MRKRPCVPRISRFGTGEPLIPFALATRALRVGGKEVPHGKAADPTDWYKSPLPPAYRHHIHLQQLGQSLLTHPQFFPR
jgi:hypothetical protein